MLVIADEEAPNLQVHTLRGLAPELVLAAGDLPWSYLEFVGSCVDAPLVFVPGNHDPSISRPRRGLFSEYDAAGRREHHLRPLSATNAEQRIVTAAGLRFAGLGGCVR